MYLVRIINQDLVAITINGQKERILSGNVVQGINTIDTCSFTLHPANAGFDKINDFTTLVEVTDTIKNKTEFTGRVLLSPEEMDDNGAIRKNVTCESLFGYLCDSQQLYVEEQNWTVRGLLERIISCHNSQVEAHKRFVVGNVTVIDPNDNLFCGIQRENSWESIKKKLIDVLGGEIRYRVESSGLYIDYLAEIGEHKTTPIELSKNMKSIVREKNPSSFVTRLIPYGAKLSNDTEERLTVATVNNGSIYIDDTEAIAKYGIHVGSVEFDDVTQANILLTKARQWLTANNKVQVKYSITALDLSLLGLNIDAFEVYNYHPIKNKLLGIEDEARIIKSNKDLCDRTKSTIEIGDNFKTLSELQGERLKKLEATASTVTKIENNYVTQKKLSDEIEKIDFDGIKESDLTFITVSKT